MINFRELELSEELHSKLDNIQVDFAFQPIYRAQDGYLIGYEALMRPLGKTPLELIEEYRQCGDLHLLELITMFGACKAYKDRNYDCLISINSFPEECMTDAEEEVFHRCFPETQWNMVLEILEYTDFNPQKWEIKKNHLKLRQIRTAIDDFGIGNNKDMDIVKTYDPIVVKLDRKLVSDIHLDEQKQVEVKQYIKQFHDKNILVLAECIEKKEELDFLKAEGIDFAQGYYLGRSM